jgi:cytochrome o ubiquinol oxidase subunit 2
MIYAMPGMESRLNAVMNVPGDYEGFSSNYSGAGFTGMRFRLHGLSQPEFASWVARTRAEGEPVLDRARYLELAAPSENVPPMRFREVDPDLFRRILNRCVEEGRLCISQMAALDSLGGTGGAGTLNTMPAEGRQASVLGRAPFYVTEFCTPADSIARYGEDSLVLLDPAPAPRPDPAVAGDETL